MYNLIFLIMLLLSLGLLSWGVSQQSFLKSFGGLILFLVSISFFSLLSFWADLLWFDALGYNRRFWTVILAKFGLGFGGAVLAGFSVWVLTRGIPKHPPIVKYWPIVLMSVIGAVWGYGNWETILKFRYGVSAGIADPILGRDVGFYLFSLPFFDALYALGWWIGFLPVAAAGLYLFVIQAEGRTEGLEFELPTLPPEEKRQAIRQAARSLYFSLGMFALILAGGIFLDRYHVLYSQLGAVSGAGWTDVNIRLPSYIITSGLTAIIGIGLLSVSISPKLHDRVIHERFGSHRDLVRLVGIPVGTVVAVWFVLLGLTPGFSQWLWVSPNEITVERPYIEHNIGFTRQGYGLDDIEEQKYPVSEELTQETLSQNQHLLSEVRLWDPRALLATYEQFQEIRLYYEFKDVDIDRYTIDGKYRQVMVSPREMETANLPAQSRTFVNQHFKYTHGYGLTMAPVSDFTPEGLPNLLVKDLPPKSESPELQVEQPGIYYGEQTTDFVVANSDEKEFDYPKGEENAYIHYDGNGGVLLSNLWRKFVLGWKFGGTRFFVSGYPNENSRVMFHRDVKSRLQKLAPFLTFDSDPYVVLQEGRIYWIVDAYTTSDRYPYSEKLVGQSAASQLNGVNYIRNSVKAVIDAYHGTVTFYVYDPEDPIIQVWSRIFPEMFESRDEMPSGLQEHVRYPEGLLTTQGLVYSKYHMTDPAVFYNQEDLWVRATEKYYSNVQPVEPYYIMWEPPQSEEPEFVIMQPFTPKNRQVLIGWIAGMCDGDNYGRLLAYRFPKEKRILGTQQVETKIDQDSFLSGQLTLWDQRGSNVIRGNLLAIPLNGTMLYIEPIYLQAEAAAYPELRLVAVMHNDKLSYAETFDEALQGLFEDRTTPDFEPDDELPSKAVSLPSELASQANQAFENYLQFMSEQKFEDAARELQKLKETLKQLEAETAGGQPPKTSENIREEPQVDR